jgi:hypothetical protein
MQTFYILPPNTCSLTYGESSFTYTQNFDGPIPASDDCVFEEFLTPNDALIRAKEIDPSFDPSIILGGLFVTFDSVSDPYPVSYEGTDVTFTAEATYDDLTVSYAWFDPNNEAIPGETSSSYTLLNVNQNQAGEYTCIASAENEIGQRGKAPAFFSLTVLSNIPTGTLETGRTGLALNESTYSTFNATSVTETDTELYSPGTDTAVPCVINIETSLPVFPATPGFFTGSNYAAQLRIIATSEVIKEFEIADSSETVTF